MQIFIKHTEQAKIKYTNKNKQMDVIEDRKKKYMKERMINATLSLNCFDS